MASLTTVSGLLAKTSELQVIAMPYVEKVKCADGRKELIQEGVVIAQKRIIKPTVDVATPYVQSAHAKIVEPTKQLAAPYVARIVSGRDALLADERCQKALAGLRHVRAHPLEVAQELKTKAVDLVKYDDLVAYRAYVQSPEFQADTVKLLRDDLPTIARDAARRGLELLQQKTTLLADELQARRAAFHDAWARGFSGATSFEFDDLRSRARALVEELQQQLASRMEAVKGADYNVQEVIARLTKIFGLDKFFTSSAPAAA